MIFRQYLNFRNMTGRQAMKKFKAGKMLAFGLVVLATFCYVSSVAAQAPVKWKVVTTWTPAITLINADKYFIETVNALCKGQLEMTLYPAGEIVGSFGVFDAVQTGTVQAGFDWAGYWAGKDSAFNVIGGLPGGPIQADFITWVYAGGGNEMAAEVYGKYGMHYLYTTVISAESGIRGNKAFRTAEDYRGAKLRMSGMLQGQILKDLGAAQVMIAGQEVYQALERGMVDGAEFSTPDNDWALGFQEVTEYWNVPGWHQPASAGGIMFNKKAWDSLTEELRQKIRIAAQATTAWGLAHFNYNSGVYSKKFIDKGAKVQHLDDNTLQKIQALSYQAFLNEAQKNPLFAKAVYSMYKTIETLSHWRDKELQLMKMGITLPDMEALKTDAEKAK